MQIAGGSGRKEVAVKRARRGEGKGKNRAGEPGWQQPREESERAAGAGGAVAGAGGAAAAAEEAAAAGRTPAAG